MFIVRFSHFSAAVACATHVISQHIVNDRVDRFRISHKSIPLHWNVAVAFAFASLFSAILCESLDMDNSLLGGGTRLGGNIEESTLDFCLRDIIL